MNAKRPSNLEVGMETVLEFYSTNQVWLQL